MSAEAAWQVEAEAAIGAVAGPGLSGSRWTRCGASSLNATWRLDASDRCFFVKVNAAARRSMFEAEADGLLALAQANAIRVPAAIAVGASDRVAWLALEWLDLAPGGRDAALGLALARLHRATGARFGWHRGNTIGTTPQDNTWADDWAAFFRDRRIAPQLALAAPAGCGSQLARKGEQLLAVIPALLAGHAPSPSLLHGDLWSGNAAALVSGTPVVLDPAVHFGDRETDLAMTELFGGFARDFYAAYREAWPLAEGYPVRRTLYNLYHVLNHANLFGGGYGTRAEAMIEQLLAEVR